MGRWPNGKAVGSFKKEDEPAVVIKKIATDWGFKSLPALYYTDFGSQGLEGTGLGVGNATSELKDSEYSKLRKFLGIVWFTNSR